jgi:polyisoprenyl-teichoic acid--peptidoglycan teichoic acid transferase
MVPRLRYSVAVAPKEKPYRIYRGGRIKGPIRHEPLRKERRGSTDGAVDYPGPQPARKPRRRWAKRVVIALVALLVLAVVWGILGYLAFRGGVQDANERLPDGVRAALAPQEGMLLSNPTNILVLGIDEGGVRGRSGNARSDAILIIRSDPGENRLAQLSIPRDLRVQIPGRDGFEKINAAHAFGGPALAVRTVRSLTGLQMNHVIVVDFSTFPEVIDALGGVTINVPRRILSNRFECPKNTDAECSRWKGWRFRRGSQEMDGRRALIYARIRQNQLNPNESDITRGERQQAVIQAIADEVVSFGTYLRAPFIGGDLVRPLATDLSSGQLVQLAWREFRTPDSGRLRCRLGGVALTDGGISYIQGSEENRSVIAMVTGETAPQPPPPGSGPFGPGCEVGG